MTDPAILMEKMGRKKFIEMVTREQKGETMWQKKKRTRYGKYIKHKRCEHGVWVIEDYEPKECKECQNYVVTKAKTFQPHFNIGLGEWVDSKSQMIRSAKEKGMIHIGDDGI